MTSTTVNWRQTEDRWKFPEVEDPVEEDKEGKEPMHCKVPTEGDGLLPWTSLWKERPVNPTTHLLLAVPFHSLLTLRATRAVLPVAFTCTAVRREVWCHSPA